MSFGLNVGKPRRRFGSLFGSFSRFHSSADGSGASQTTAFFTAFVFGSTIQSSVKKSLSCLAHMGRFGSLAAAGGTTRAGILFFESSKMTLPVTVDHCWATVGTAVETRRAQGKTRRSIAGSGWVGPVDYDRPPPAMQRPVHDATPAIRPGSRVARHSSA